MTLEWEPVEGAAAYVVYRADGDAEFHLLDHGGGDVLAVPAPPYADTDAVPGTRYGYRVAAMTTPDAAIGELSESVEGTPLGGGDGVPEVALQVDASAPEGPLARPWWMIGSEHLSQVEYEGGEGPASIGEEFTEALRLATKELGISAVRAHAILHDENGVYREVDGAPELSFDAVDAIYDRVLGAGCIPIVEMSFMPRDLAVDPDATVFEYGAIVSPPKDWDRWAELTGRLAEHLVDRYGIEEVARWAFEIWNEPNLEVFWSGTQQEYMRLYEVAARAIKAVDESLRVGGPATAASGWIEAFLAFVQERDLPLDFLSTHVYGIPPLDLHGVLERYGFGAVPVWWTEWGVSARHFGDVMDAAFGAPFVLSGIKHAQETGTAALAYWVVSDHFEELGRPQGLLHGGFGLLTVGNLRKPRYWALLLAQQLGEHSLRVELDGDGARSMVEALATSSADGSVDVLAWNGTLDQDKRWGSRALERRLIVRISGLSRAGYEAVVARVDGRHSNISAHWSPERGWPGEAGWQELRALDRLHEDPLGLVAVEDGWLELALDLPSPGVARLRLTPAH